MPIPSTKSGDLISRYFERVLGVRNVSSQTAEMFDTLPSERTEVKSVCLLVEIGTGSDTPSIQEMGARLVEAIRNEWLKQSLDHLPEIEWMRTEDAAWQDAVAARGSAAVLVIVCGAHHLPSVDSRVVHVSSFLEMQDSHVLKRESWRAMQQRISAFANSVVHHTSQ